MSQSLAVVLSQIFGIKAIHVTTHSENISQSFSDTEIGTRAGETHLRKTPKNLDGPLHGNGPPHLSGSCLLWRAGSVSDKCRTKQHI